MQYESDQEQWEAVKAWIKDNALSMIVTFVLAGSAVYGWKYWQQYRVVHGEQASVGYQQFIMQVGDNELKKAGDSAKVLINDFDNTPYADLASLMLTKQAVDKKELAAAIQKLQRVIDDADDSIMRQVARIRGVRILLAMRKYQDAMTMINIVDNKAYQPLIDEVKGDVWLAMGEKAKAHKAYEKSLDAMPRSLRRYVELKLQSTS